MRCYICDTETDFIDKRDFKPICECCQEAVQEVMQEWWELDEDTPDVPEVSP